MQTEAPRDGRSLRDLAKLAGTPAQVPNADSSGLVDLAALMAAQPNWLDDALARAKTNARASRPYDSVSQISLAPTAREMVPEEPAGVPRRRLLPMVLGATGAALVVAVACVVALRGHRAEAAPSAPKAVVVAAHVDESAIPPPPDAVDLATAAAPSDDAPAPAKERPAAASRRGRHGSRDTARVSSSVAKAAPRTAAAPPTSALDSALRAAAGPPAPAAAAAPVAAASKTAASPTAEGRPERPSGSAVTSALTQVLPAARACLVAGTDASRATVSFGSEGAVQKVDVIGPAAGDAKAASCLRAAFGRAHVPPFSQSSYSAAVNVRPR
jgi:hypothetical protein